MSFRGYFDEMVRLRSFKDWPLTCTSGILLAKQGVYCFKSDGQVICAFCLKHTHLRNENTSLFRIIPDLNLHHDWCSGTNDKRNIRICNSIQRSFHPQDGDRKYGNARFLGVRLEGIMALQEIYDHPGDDTRIVLAFQETLAKSGGEWSFEDIIDKLE
ncbi:uncharacterized protein LOC117327392 isoform X2 [Pecten maximus]|uniref:uncharacterized protein LOC117327392 isoform X2 n=1 Tax=Pecten maximus TaxID=6579 RepID=UPI001458F028|nr:uncharacterized protein LOC117327392 isoform X2 [Pecten maximus]